MKTTEQAKLPGPIKKVTDPKVTKIPKWLAAELPRLSNKKKKVAEEYSSFKPKIIDRQVTSPHSNLCAFKDTVLASHLNRVAILLEDYYFYSSLTTRAEGRGSLEPDIR